MIPTMATLQEVFLHELQDLHSAESQLIAALPKLKEASASETLAKAFETHLKQTKEHKNRLQQIGKLLGESLSGETCKAMQGLVEEGQSIIEEFDESSARDVALIAAAQRVEHYEISAYGSAMALAKALGHQEVVSILESTLGEEKETDVLLSEISESEVIPSGLSEASSEQVGDDSEVGNATASASEDLESLTREDLYEMARGRQIEGRSSMSKKELVKALS